MDKPVVVVVENPEEDPDVFVYGDVDLIELTTYPMSKWCDPAEVLDYGMDYVVKLQTTRDRFPQGSNEWGSLNGLLKIFLERMNEAMKEVEIDGDA